MEFTSYVFLIPLIHPILFGLNIHQHYGGIPSGNSVIGKYVLLTGVHHSTPVYVNSLLHSVHKVWLGNRCE